MHKTYNTKRGRYTIQIYNVEGGGYLEMNVIAWDPAGDTHKGAAAEEVDRILTLSQFGRKLLKI